MFGTGFRNILKDRTYWDKKKSLRPAIYWIKSLMELSKKKIFQKDFTIIESPTNQRNTAAANVTANLSEVI